MDTDFAQRPPSSEFVSGLQKWSVWHGSGKPMVHCSPSNTPAHWRISLMHVPDAHSPFSMHPSPCFCGPKRHTPAVADAVSAANALRMHCSDDAGSYGLSASGFWNWHSPTALLKSHAVPYVCGGGGRG